MTNLPVAVLISGGGSTLKNLIEHQQDHHLPIDFKLVISSRRSARGIEFANEAEIPVKVIARRDFSNAQDHSRAIFDQCDAHGVKLVIMGGYLEHLLIPTEYTNRVVNIHPSLIPAFSGKGFYGLRVHQAAVDYGVKVAGCTAHFVDNEFDHGPILAQATCDVRSDDTAETLQDRVLQLERKLYPEVVAAIARGQVTLTGRHATIDSSYA